MKKLFNLDEIIDGTKGNPMNSYIALTLKDYIEREADRYNIIPYCFNFDNNLDFDNSPHYEVEIIKDDKKEPGDVPPNRMLEKMIKILKKHSSEKRLNVKYKDIVYEIPIDSSVEISEDGVKGQRLVLLKPKRIS